MKRFIGTQLLIMMLLFSCNKENVIDNLNEMDMLYPHGNETIVIGGNFDIVWFNGTASHVNIDLYKESVFAFNIASNIENDGFYDWHLLDYIPKGDGFQVRISNYLDSTDYCESKSNIKIIQKPNKSSFKDARDGQVYEIVKLGDQWWMAENFNYDADEGCYSYDESIEERDAYGKLYSFEAAVKNCPIGWHLPSDEEWIELELYLGLPESEIYKVNDRGRIGDYLKFDGWTGFDITYGGYRNSGYDYNGHVGWEAHFWTSTITNEGYVVRVISELKSGIARVNAKFHGGSSVRYIKN